MVEKIFWLGHSGIRIQSETVLYIDPFQIAGGPQADLILITHVHHDHFSPEDIRKIRGGKTVIVTTPDVAEQLAGEVRSVRPGDRLTVGPVAIEAVPAYNLDKFREPGVPFHPREAGYVGYVFTLDGVRYYHAGDTDAVPEMREVRCDVALLPVSGTYVMTHDEACGACDMVTAAVAVPMHYGDIVGDAGDAEAFRAGCSLPVTLLSLEGG